MEEAHFESDGEKYGLGSVKACEYVSFDIASKENMEDVEKKFLDEKAFCCLRHQVCESTFCGAAVTTQATPIKFMEICCPAESTLADCMQEHGCEVMRLGLHNGYDLSKKSGFLKAADMVKRFKPDKM